MAAGQETSGTAKRLAWEKAAGQKKTGWENTGMGKGRTIDREREQENAGTGKKRDRKISGLEKPRWAKTGKK